MNDLDNVSLDELLKTPRVKVYLITKTYPNSHKIIAKRMNQKQKLEKTYVFVSSSLFAENKEDLEDGKTIVVDMEEWDSELRTVRKKTFAYKLEKKS